MMNYTRITYLFLYNLCRYIIDVDILRTNYYKLYKFNLLNILLYFQGETIHANSI